MADFYLDPIGGSDAADGTTFANRWKTLTSGATAARIAPGDTIRIIASPDPTTPGSATWTDNSGVVTWAAAKNKVIDDCETNWTAAANITCSQSTVRKQGSFAQAFTPATGFTTGKVAHFPLPASLDLSAFQQVSFWFYYGALTTAGQIELRLCSDTTGDTAVHTIALPAGTSNKWRTVVWDNGAALSSAVQSVAIYVTADPGTSEFRIDNIVACAAAASANCVTHEHVIGKNTGGEPWWYAVASIGDDTVTLGGHRDATLGSGTVTLRPYRGTTESVSTYMLRGLNGWAASDNAIQDSGTDGLPILFSGGWNRTDMSTQTGITYLNGQHILANAISASSKTWLKTEKIGAMYYTGPLFNDATCSDIDLSVDQVVGSGGIVAGHSASARAWKIRFVAVQGNSADMALKSSASTNRGVYTISGDRIHGACTSTSSVALALATNARYEIGRIDNNGGFGCSSSGLSIEGTTATLVGTTLENNAGGTDVSLSEQGILRLYDCIYTTASVANAGINARILSTRDQGAADAHKVIGRYFTVSSVTDQRHTASGVSWKIQPLDTTNVSSLLPAQFSLGKVAVAAGAAVTVKCWARRDNAGLSISILIPAEALPGVGATALRDEMTAAIDTWEELSLSFTPTVAGVFEVFGIAWGGTTYSGWFDDPTVTQA